MSAIAATNEGLREGAFVGREGALTKLRALLRDGARVLCVTGPAGVGKSRLVHELVVARARELPRELSYEPSYEGSAVRCALGDVADVEEVVERIAERLGVELPAAAADETPDLLGELLGTRGALLLVLDGVDRARPAVREIVERWLLLAPLVRFLVTGREPLSLPEEVRLKLGPLRAPPATVDDADAIAGYEAVQLFVERARRVARGFTLAPAEAPAVAEIVRRLHGLPLAIELAASRVGAYSPTELLERLPSRVELLKTAKPTGGEAPGPRRQRPSGRTGDGLTSTIDWSWRLLKPWEQTALAQSSVFRGGFSLEAAERVLDLSAHEGAPGVKEVLSSLRAKSLLRMGEVRGEHGRERRYVHYASVRDFAEAWLEERGGAHRAQSRHARYYLAFCGALADAVDRHEGRRQRRRLEREAENLVAVVRNALLPDPVTVHDVTHALEGLLALEPILSTRGPFSVHLSLLDAALAPAEVLGVSPELHARALESRGRVLRARGQLARSLEDLEGALALARAAGDRLLEGRVLANVGTHHVLTGRLDEAEREYTRAFALLRAEGAKAIEARALLFLGQLRQRQGKPREAMAEYERAIEALREVGDRRYEGITLGEAASLLVEEGALERATHLYEHALSIHREIGNRRYEGASLRELGSARLEEGQLAEARALLDKAVLLLKEVFDRPGEARALTRLGDLLVEEGSLVGARAHYEQAARLGAVEATRDALLHARLAGLHALAGHREAAREALAEARRLTAPEGDRRVADALLLYEDIVDAALGEWDVDASDERTLRDLPQGRRARSRRGSELRAARRVAQLLRARLP